MGDPFNFHGSKWTGKKFDQMWQYWVQCYPAHAHDIERELYQSKKETRKAWWDIKNSARVVITKPTGKRSRPDDIVGPLPTSPKRLKMSPRLRCEKGHFEITYLESPCQICGSSEHPALQEKEDEYCETSFHYACPLAGFDDWEEISMRPCPVKLAAHCGYNEYRVLKAWHRLIEDGWGQKRNSKTLGRFLNVANKACRDHQG